MFCQLASYDLYLEQGADGKGKSIGVTARQGLLLALPEARELLPRIALALRGWTKLKPVQSYPPLTWELAVLIAVRMIRDGHFTAGVGFLLAFDCY